MNTVKLQIPIDKKVRAGLEKRAKDLGFDSAQAYIRVWAKAETEGRKLDFDNIATTLSDNAIRRYDKMINELEKNDTKSFDSVEKFMEGLK